MCSLPYELYPNTRIARHISEFIVFKFHARKRQLVPYSIEKALKLMIQRKPLSSVFTSPSEVLEIPAGTIGRNKLVMKHKSTSDLMRYAMNDVWCHVYTSAKVNVF